MNMSTDTCPCTSCTTDAPLPAVRSITLPPVNPAELGTILAALRWLQHSGGLLPQPGAQWLRDIATDNGEHEALDHDQIDTLYDHLNG